MSDFEPNQEQLKPNRFSWDIVNNAPIDAGPEELYYYLCKHLEITEDETSPKKIDNTTVRIFLLDYANQLRLHHQDNGANKIKSAEIIGAIQMAERYMAVASLSDFKVIKEMFDKAKAITGIVNSVPAKITKGNN